MGQNSTFKHCIVGDIAERPLTPAPSLGYSVTVLLVRSYTHVQLYGKTENIT